LVAKHHQKVRRQRNAFQHKTSRALVRDYDALYLEDLRVAKLVATAPSPRASQMRAGQRSVPPLPTRQRAPVSKCCWWNPPLPARSAVAAERACRRASRYVRTSALHVGWYWTATRTRPRTSSGPGRPVVERWVHAPW